MKKNFPFRFGPPPPPWFRSGGPPPPWHRHRDCNFFDSIDQLAGLQIFNRGRCDPRPRPSWDSSEQFPPPPPPNQWSQQQQQPQWQQNQVQNTAPPPIQSTKRGNRPSNSLDPLNILGNF